MVTDVVDKVKQNKHQKLSKSHKNNILRYMVVLKHLKTVSKLSVLKPINKYDYVSKLKISTDIMKQIDKEIVSEFTLLNI